MDGTTFSDTPDKVIYGIESSSNKAKFLARRYDQMIKRSLDRMLVECKNKVPYLKTPDQPIAQLIAPRLPPGMHYRHHQLQAAMRAGSVNRVQDSISRIVEEMQSPSSKGRSLAISSIGSSEWETFSASEASKLSLIEQGTIEVLEAVPQRDLDSSLKSICTAIDLIKLADHDLFHEVVEHVHDLKLFNGNITQGFSDIRIMGAVFIRRASTQRSHPLYYYEQLIHEMSHIQLNCIFAVEDLLVGDRFQNAPSPLRRDLRPLFGVYHATYVSAKVAYSFYRLYLQTLDNKILHYLSQTINELILGIDTIKRFPLTSAGAKLSADMIRVAHTVARDRIWSSYDFSASTPHRWCGHPVVATRFERFYTHADI